MSTAQATRTTADAVVAYLTEVHRQPPIQMAAMPAKASNTQALSTSAELLNYRGPAPATSPEVQAMEQPDLLDQTAPAIDPVEAAQQTVAPPQLAQAVSAVEPVVAAQLTAAPPQPPDLSLFDPPQPPLAVEAQRPDPMALDSAQARRTEEIVEASLLQAQLDAAEYLRSQTDSAASDDSSTSDEAETIHTDETDGDDPQLVVSNTSVPSRAPGRGPRIGPRPEPSAAKLSLSSRPKEDGQRLT